LGHPTAIGKGKETGAGFVLDSLKIVAVVEVELQGQGLAYELDKLLGQGVDRLKGLGDGVGFG
jgi:hypothetical protein